MQTIDQPKYIMYVRKSTDDTSRQIRSLKDQEAERWELTRTHGIDVIDVLREKIIRQAY